MKKKNYIVESFGSGNCVKLPGTTIDRPNVYKFDSTYKQIFKDLQEKDTKFYTRNGVLGMLERNMRIKEAPERFQNCPETFDIVISLDERVYDQIIEYFYYHKKATEMKQVHVININVKDNHEEATIGAFAACDIAKLLSEFRGDLDDEIGELLLEHEETSNRKIYHSVHFY